MSTFTPEQFIKNESLAKSFCEENSINDIPAIINPDGTDIVVDGVGHLLGECAKGESLNEDDQETDVPNRGSIIIENEKHDEFTLSETNKLVDKDGNMSPPIPQIMTEQFTINQIKTDIELLKNRQQQKYEARKKFLEDLKLLLLPITIEQSIIQEVRNYLTTFNQVTQQTQQTRPNNLTVILDDFNFFLYSWELYINDERTDIETFKKWYYYFSAWDSPMLNNSFIIDENFYLLLISHPMMITGEIDGFYMYKKFAEKPLPIPSDNFLSAIYVSKKDDNGEKLVLFEFIGVKHKSVNEILIPDIVDNYRITSEFLTISFPQLSFLPATKNRFPIQTAITTIFKINGKTDIQSILPHIIKPENIDMFANMVLYYEDFVLTNIIRSGEVNLASECNNFYDSKDDYSKFANLLDTKTPIPQISFKNFKKYLENYIVNFCTPKFPSLKMVSFLKITYLNEFMIKNGWGYVDTAGGSLFNYIDNQSIVTADYDFKIYFFDTGVPLEILIKREIYIKQWFINISHNLNEYMRSIKMLNTFEISGGFELFTGIIFKIKLNSKRPFTSRGKEPELFPIPLYSDDLLLDMLICDSSNTCKKTTLKLNIGYFDLVFKRFSHSYLGELHPSFGGRDIVARNIRLIQPGGTTNVTQYPIPKETDIKNSFLVRTPTFYEIWEDVINLQNNPGFYLKRLTTGKDGKDKIRLIKLYDKFISFYPLLSVEIILGALGKDLNEHAIQQLQQYIIHTKAQLTEDQINKHIELFIQIVSKLLAVALAQELAQAQAKLAQAELAQEQILEYKNDMIKKWWELLKTIPNFIQAMIEYPMDNGTNAQFINNCYYQYNKTAQMAGSLQFLEIQTRCFFSFRPEMTNIMQPFHFHPITWIYWSFIVWSKKYTEFKDGSDMKRIEIAKNIPRLLSEVDNPTTKKIIDKLSGYRKNLLETELVPEYYVLPDLNPSLLYLFILEIMKIFNPLMPTLVDRRSIPLLDSTLFQGGYSKTRKNRKKLHSKPTRNKKSNLKSKSKTKSNKTKKNKKRRRKNNRSKK